MQVDVTVKRSDMVWFILSKYVRPGAGIREFLITVLSVMFIRWIFNVRHPSEIDWVAFAISSGSIALVLLGGILVVSILYVLVANSEKSGVLGKHTYTIKHDGLRELTKANDTLHFWPSIANVDYSSKGIIVQINAHLFHILPRREFQNDEQSKAFYQLLVNRCRNAG